MKALTKVSNDSITRMPAFNKTIQIELDVDTINERVLDLLPEDYKHREVLSHAIVGAAMAAGNLTYLCKALHGYTNEIDFKVGDEVICTEKDRPDYYDAHQQNEDGSLRVPALDPTDEEYEPNWKRRMVAIGKCRIIDIELYKDNKLQVEYEWQSRQHGGTFKTERSTEWVSHKNCTRVPLED
jgi:hypothetical protein